MLASRQRPVPESAMSSKSRADELLDEALEESFPASDPIALSAANRHLNDAPAAKPGHGHKPKKPARWKTSQQKTRQ